MTSFGMTLNAVTVAIAAVGAAAVLLWWSARLIVRLIAAAAIVLVAAVVVYLVTGQGPSEWWPALINAADQLGAYIAHLFAGTQA